MTRSGRILREGHHYFLEQEETPVVPEIPALEVPPPPEGGSGLELAVAKIRRWFFDHPEQEVHDSILLHKLEISEDRLVEGLKLLISEGTLTLSTESDFLGTAYCLSPNAEKVLSEVEPHAPSGIDTLELKARLDGIKRTLFSISKDLGRLESLVRNEIEGENL